MIESARGDLLKAPVEALVNAVNCVGVMGAGIALQFRQAYPLNDARYKQACDAGDVRIGQVLTVPTSRPTRPRYIINFPTKKHWRPKSKLEYVEQGLPALVEDVRRLHLASVAIPHLGCGNGGLDWAAVKPLIEAAFAELPELRVLLYEASCPHEAGGDNEHPVQLLCAVGAARSKIARQ